MARVNDIYPHGPPTNHYIDPAYIKYINYTPHPSIQMVKTYLSIPIEYPNKSAIPFKDIRIKISDFGICTHILIGYAHRVGTLEDYDDEETRRKIGHGSRTIVAPEVLLGCDWDHRADIWSAGATVTPWILKISLIN